MGGVPGSRPSGMNRDNLRKVEDLGIRFLSRLPENFGVAEALKTRAWEEGGGTTSGRSARTR